MTRTTLVVTAFVCALASISQAAPYWVAWEGDDFPENEGWERLHLRENGPKAVRSLSQGVLNIDGLESIEIQDYYQLQPGSLDPEFGEEFVVQWRLRVNDVDFLNPNFPYDPGWELRSDEGWAAIFVIGENEIHSLIEQQDIQFEAGRFHEWEFRSTDMRSYRLLLDGVTVTTGFLSPTTAKPRLAWGDFVAGTASNSDWDYFRFGVVPEPSSLMLFATGLALTSRRQRCETESACS